MFYKIASKVARLCLYSWSLGCKMTARETEAEVPRKHQGSTEHVWEEACLNPGWGTAQQVFFSGPVASRLDNEMRKSMILKDKREDSWNFQIKNSRSNMQECDLHWATQCNTLS